MLRESCWSSGGSKNSYCWALSESKLYTFLSNKSEAELARIIEGVSVRDAKDSRPWKECKENVDLLFSVDNFSRFSKRIFKNFLKPRPPSHSHSGKTKLSGISKSARLKKVTSEFIYKIFFFKRYIFLLKEPASLWIIRNAIPHLYFSEWHYDYTGY